MGQERVSARSGRAGENVARNRGSTRLPLKMNGELGRRAQWKIHQPTSLAHSIHEHCCCNRRSAATTSLRPVGLPFGPSTYCTSMPQVLWAPHAGLATRLNDFATNCHGQCGLERNEQAWREHL
jgi:hypothetical protein